MPAPTAGDEREALAAAVALITAKRAGLPDDQYSQLVTTTMTELAGGDDEFTAGLRIGVLVRYLITIAAELADGLDGLAPGTPGTSYVQAAAQAAAEAKE